MLAMSGCIDEHSYCIEVERNARIHKLIDTFKRWTNDVLTDRSIATELIVPAGGMWPDEYFVYKKFDWQSVEYDRLSQMRLVGV